MALSGQRSVRSWSCSRLLDEARAFISQFPETLAIFPKGASRIWGTHAGLHSRSLSGLAADLTRQVLADRNLAPLTQLAAEAITARVVHRVRGELRYFKPVCGMPGFPRALARTLGDLRLAQVQPEPVERAGEAGQD